MKIASSSDYASIWGDGFDFYYGYERTLNDDEDAEWCFVAKLNGREIVIPESELKKVDGSQGKFECDRMLMAGIAIIAANGWLRSGSFVSDP